MSKLGKKLGQMKSGAEGKIRA